MWYGLWFTCYGKSKPFDLKKENKKPVSRKARKDRRETKIKIL